MMTKRPSLYRIFSGFFACVVLAAGALKIQDYLTTPGGESRLLSAAVGSFEVLLGAWILLGFYPRWTRVVALGCFLGFLNVALYKTLSGSESCGCFGKLSVRPWVAVAVDAAGFLALLFTRPNAAAEAGPARRQAGIAFAAVGLGLSLAAVALALLVADRDGLGTAGRGLGRGERLLVRRVMEEVDRNYGATKSLAFEVRLSIRNAGVKKEETIVKKEPDGSVRTTYITPEVRQVQKYFIRGANVRRDGSPVGPFNGESIILAHGQALQYMPKNQRAWLRGTHDHEAQPVDPRCIGLLPPAHSVAEWLRDIAVSSAETERGGGAPELIVVRATDNRKHPVEAKFSAEQNCLPVSVVYSHDDGSVYYAATLAYRRLPGTDGWLLHQAVQRAFDRGAAASPDSANWKLQFTFSVEEAKVEVNPALPDETFNPRLPPGTFVTNRNGDSFTVRDEAPAFSMTRLTDREVALGGSGAGGGKWLTFAAVNACLTGLCILQRRRIGF